MYITLMCGYLGDNTQRRYVYHNNASDCYKSRVLEATCPLGRYITDCSYFLFVALVNMLFESRREVLQVKVFPDLRKLQLLQPLSQPRLRVDVNRVSRSC